MFALALHLLLIVAVAQAWMSGWPGKIWLSLGVIVAIANSVVLYRRWRSAPFIIGCIAVAAAFLWASFQFGSDAAGLRLGGLPFGSATAALIIVALAAGAFQLWTLASSPRLPAWARFIPAAIALYAIALLVLGIVRAVPTVGAMSAAGPVPWWISGQYVAGAVLLPIGLVVALIVLGLAIARRRAGIVSALAILVMMMSACLMGGLELTRNGWPNLAQFVVPASFVAVSSAPRTSTTPEVVSASTPVNAALGVGEESLIPFEGKDLDEIFARVATGVRYEPYNGILRGSYGTAIAKSGNSADQTMLLAELLRRAGYKVRYARGQMADENINAMIRGMYPPRVPALELTADYSPYDPQADNTLRAVVREHMWVEVLQDSGWLPLDPSFPRARIGDTYATATEQFDTPADGLYHTIDGILREQTVDGATRELGRFSGKVAELALRPISVVVRAIPQSAGGDASGKAAGSPSAIVGGFGGALGGGEPPKEAAKPVKVKKEIVGVAYVRTLLVGGESKKIARTTVLSSKPQSSIRREWIEFNLTAPRTAARRVERVLYPVDEKNNKPADERRYTISLVAGRISMTFAEQQTALASALIDPKSMQKRADGLAGIGPDDSRAMSAVAELIGLDDAAGVVAGHLLTLRFAAESDSISRIVADGTGLALSWATPRIIISSVETSTSGKDRTDAKVSLDLRLDEITTYPYPGAPTALASVFQAARGIQESVIEGGLIGILRGKQQTANTSLLMEAAYDADIPLVVISASTRSTLNDLTAPPKNCLEMIEAALAKGHEIIIPVRAVPLAGAERWGWWEVDPVTNAMIGVMESGEHQAMAEYSLNSDRIGLNDESGRALGSLVGSMATMGTLSALMLKYGSNTAELMAELKAQVSSIMCFMCFDKAKATAERKITFSIGDECFKKEFKAQIGAEVKVGFCDAYLKGFKCASGVLIAALERKPFDKATYSIQAGVTLGCAKWQEKSRAGTGT